VGSNPRFLTKTYIDMDNIDESKRIDKEDLRVVDVVLYVVNDNGEYEYSCIVKMTDVNPRKRGIIISDNNTIAPSTPGEIDYFAFTYGPLYLLERE
jgi:hypothetical protein